MKQVNLLVPLKPKAIVTGGVIQLPVKEIHTYAERTQRLSHIVNRKMEEAFADKSIPQTERVTSFSKAIMVSDSDIQNRFTISNERAQRILKRSESSKPVIPVTSRESRLQMSRVTFPEHMSAMNMTQAQKLAIRAGNSKKFLVDLVSATNSRKRGNRDNIHFDRLFESIENQHVYHARSIVDKSSTSPKQKRTKSKEPTNRESEQRSSVQAEEIPYPTPFQKSISKIELRPSFNDVSKPKLLKYKNFDEVFGDDSKPTIKSERKVLHKRYQSNKELETITVQKNTEERNQEAILYRLGSIHSIEGESSRLISRDDSFEKRNSICGNTKSMKSTIYPQPWNKVSQVKAMRGESQPKQRGFVSPFVQYTENKMRMSMQRDSSKQLPPLHGENMFRSTMIKDDQAKEDYCKVADDILNSITIIKATGESPEKQLYQQQEYTRELQTIVSVPSVPIPPFFFLFSVIQANTSSSFLTKYSFCLRMFIMFEIPSLLDSDGIIKTPSKLINFSICISQQLSRAQMKYSIKIENPCTKLCCLIYQFI